MEISDNRVCFSTSMFSFCPSSSSGFIGAARHTDQDLNNCLGNQLWRLRGGDDDGGGNWNQSSWATARAMAAMSRNETDGRVATVAVWRRSIAPPEAAWRDPPAFPRGGRRSAWTHPVPDDLSEASVRLEVTLEGNSLSDDDGRQGLDGNSQISFRDRQRERRCS